MEEVHSANAGPDLVESPTYAQPEILEQAIAKLVLLGKTGRRQRRSDDPVAGIRPLRGGVGGVRGPAE